jgi:hypothetical protein
VNAHGYSASFWVNGMMVYCAIVILANMEVLFQSNNYNWVTLFVNLGSSATFFLVYAVESNLDWIPNLYGTFFYFWETAQFYLLLIFLVITQIFIQATFRDITKMVYEYKDKKGRNKKGPINEELPSVAEEKPNKVAPLTSVQRSHTGYAFS